MLTLSSQKAFLPIYPQSFEALLLDLYQGCEFPDPIYLIRDDSGHINIVFAKQMEFLSLTLKTIQQDLALECDNIDEFLTEFLAEDLTLSRFVGQSNGFFSEIKRMLEIIAIQLQTPHQIANKKNFFMDLLQGMAVCGPGIFTHIQTLYHRVTNQENIPYWLAELRSNIVSTYADKHIQRKEIVAGNSIHAHIAYRKLAWQHQLNLLGEEELVSLTDINFASLAKITEEDKDDFYSFFIDNYTPANILETLTQRASVVLAKINTTYFRGELWLSTSAATYNDLVNSLEEWLDRFHLKERLNVSYLLTPNEDWTEVKLNPALNVELANLIALGLEAFNLINIDHEPQTIATNLQLYSFRANGKSYQWLQKKEEETITYQFLSDYLYINQENSESLSYQTLLKAASCQSIRNFFTLYHSLPKSLTIVEWIEKSDNLEDLLGLATCLETSSELKLWLNTANLNIKLAELFIKEVGDKNFSYLLQRIKPYLNQINLNHVSQDKNYKNQSIAFWLTNYPEGLEYLREQTTKAPGLKISAHALNAIVEAPGYQGKSVLFNLAQLENGYQILNANYARLIKLIDIQAFSSEVESAIHGYLSPAFMVAATSQETCEIYSKHNYHLAKLLNEELLNKRITKGPFQGTSIAFFLAQNTLGLLTLTNNNHRLGQMIQKETLNHCIEGENYHQQSLALTLIKSFIGRKLLSYDNYQLSKKIIRDQHQSPELIAYLDNRRNQLPAHLQYGIFAHRPRRDPMQADELADRMRARLNLR